MILKDIESKRIMHVDTSIKFYQLGNTGIASKIVGSGQHKGVVISNKLKRELDRDLTAGHDYARLYAICIYYLIKDNLMDFDVLVICNDENFIYVKLYLDLLFDESQLYKSKYITNISELRAITGNKKLRSFANNTSNIYRRKGLKNLQRQQKGVPINVIRVTYQEIKDKWEEINKKK